MQTSCLCTGAHLVCACTCMRAYASTHVRIDCLCALRCPCTCRHSYKYRFPEGHDLDPVTAATDNGARFSNRQRLPVDCYHLCHLGIKYWLLVLP